MKLYKISNGNLLIWSGSWGPKENNIDHVLLTTDAEALFFSTIKKFDLSSQNSDFLNLDNRAFKQKYDLPNLNSDLFLELQSGLKKGDYPLNFGSHPSYTHKCPKCGNEFDCNTIYETSKF